MENKLQTKLFTIQNLNLSFKKTKENPFFHSKYLSLEALLKGLQPILEKNKLLIYHMTTPDGVNTVLQDVDSSEKIVSCFPLQAGLEPQKVGSAITYAKRYNIGQIFNIITDEDDDGNKTSYKKPFVKKETENVTKFFKDIQPTDEEVIEWQELLESSRTAKEARDNWKKIPPMVQAKLEKVKDQVKAKLS